MFRTTILTIVLLVLPASSALAISLPDPAGRPPIVKRMYACNHKPASWSRTELECVVRTRFANESSNAFKIVACESVWTPTAVSRTSDYGLFQINHQYNIEGWRMGANIFDPVWNTRIAYYFWVTRGWSDWTCARIMGVS